jgi:hypothetical protein
MNTKKLWKHELQAIWKTSIRRATAIKRRTATAARSKAGYMNRFVTETLISI